MILSPGWIVYGSVTDTGVQLVASRYAEAQLGKAFGRARSNATIEIDAQVLGRLEVIDAPDWRAALEELYRRWHPDGGPLSSPPSGPR